MKLIEVRIVLEEVEETTILEEYEAYGPHDAYSQAEAQYPDAVLIEVVGAVA
jgi:hypothetical protein